MVDLTINTDLARQILVNFIRSEVTRVGYSRDVVGLSGGIDSALSCALAVEALGADNVLAVRMPYKSSSPDSLTHAGLPHDDDVVFGLDPLTCRELADGGLVDPTLGIAQDTVERCASDELCVLEASRETAIIALRPFAIDHDPELFLEG